MPKHYTPEFKKHHVDAWRASGLTRRQYAESQAINEGSFKHWPSQIKTKNNPSARLLSVLPVQIAQPSAPEALTDPVMVYLPGGYRVACQTAQLADVFRALKYAEA
ncbi:IS66 family insertion sequence element accessory protein TnpA [Serratia sp. UGAL515B_01]|uniref:IS66 family insertion sequence element accessory protein TnpA n=1 Tax=Serratia sp. UGAL515B_01 TaxID=2986763 RepID=UPI002952A754|nr:IS66 family insertion sequence element accessory protein TnpB [Serratia sp. UGAL515B_01]WON78258.1 IS66 family insertion sequence element accessory protein TnpB [Serratia sp. UGAL515B_01]